MPQTVPMTRDAKAFPQSHDANVHPDQVGAFEALGWRVAGAASDDAGLTKAEIIADLEAMGVEFDPRDKRADLLIIRDVARAERDAAAG